MTVYGWLLLTIAVYMGARLLYKSHPRLYTQPIIVSAAALICAVAVGSPDATGYSQGTKPLSTLLGPATVCLAVPLYRHAASIRRAWRPTVAAIVVGTVVGLALPPLIMLLIQGPPELGISMAPKSATTPIAMEVSRALGGNVELTALFTVATGLLGTIVGVPLLQLFGVRDPRIMGVAIGISSHAIGTAQMIERSSEHGSFSAFAMTVTGILTAVLSLPLYM